jgi:hypothetical protein
MSCELWWRVVEGLALAAPSMVTLKVIRQRYKENSKFRIQNSKLVVVD